MKLIVKFKPTTLGFKKRTAFSFLPSCARIKSPARRQFNTDRVRAGPRIRIRRSSLEGVWQFSSVYLHFINRKQDLSFSSSSAGAEFHGDFGSHPHPSLQARRQKRAGQVFFNAHFKMAATDRCRLVTSIQTWFSTGLECTWDLREEYAFASGKNV